MVYRKIQILKRFLQNKLFKDIFPWLVGVAAVFAYVSPWVLAGESGYIRIHDSLDSVMAWYKILAESTFWFAPNQSQVGLIAEDGMPRIAYPRELSVISWIFAIFEPYWAYVANQFVLRIVAFTGMYLLLRSIIQEGPREKTLIVLGVSLCYSFLPFWSWTGSVASLPFIFYALVKIWQGNIGISEIIILISYPFYSDTVHTGMFLIGIVWSLALIKYLKYRKMNPLFVGALITTAAHLVVDYRLWSHLFLGGMIPHRIDMIFFGYSFSESWAQAKQIFFNGDWAATLHNLVILKIISVALILVCINLIWVGISTKISSIVESKSGQQILRLLLLLMFVVSILFLYSRYWNWTTVGTFIEVFPSSVTSAALIFTSIYFIWINVSTPISAWTSTLESWKHCFRSAFSIAKSEPWPQGLILSMVLLFVSCIVISSYVAFWNWSTVVSFRQTFSILMQVNFTRISFFLPFIWMVTFALALVIIVKTIRLPIVGILLVTLVIGHQLKVELDHHEYTQEEYLTGINFRQFYSEELFTQIATMIPDNRKSYVVGGIGIHPSILQYNGFRTADGYLALYPIAYKLKFRKAVINEFSKNEALLSYFDNWGSMFYFFSSEMMCPRNGDVCKKHRDGPKVIKHFDLDIDATRALGVKYLFSVATISNATELGLSSMGTYSTFDSPWIITVYKLPG